MLFQTHDFLSSIEHERSCYVLYVTNLDNIYFYCTKIAIRKFFPIGENNNMWVSKLLQILFFTFLGTVFSHIKNSGGRVTCQ